MADKGIALSPKASISLQTMGQKHEWAPSVPLVAMSAGLVRVRSRSMAQPPPDEARASVIVETTDEEKIGNELVRVDSARVQKVAPGFLTAEVPVAKAAEIYGRVEVERMQTLKRKKLLMNHAMADGGIIASSSESRRLVPQSGNNVLVAIIDSGFDLSHPMFRDGEGKLRVEALLDQSANDREYTTAQLESGWASGRKPGGDEDGHGTHVASIAAGSAHKGLSGVAPGSRLLLIKTDYVNLAAGAAWAFRKAGPKPCVVNISLGHHYGAHDGSDQEERAFERMVGAGRIIAMAAGNEREDNIHVGKRFSSGDVERLVFDVARNQEDPPNAIITFWYDRSDKFEFTLTSPSGRSMEVPAQDRSTDDSVDRAHVSLARQRYAHNNLVQVQFQLSFSNTAPNASLRNWKIGMTCRTAVVGRLDGWFQNSGYGEFRPGSMIETARTVGLPATSKAVVCVASHASRNAWTSERGQRSDVATVIGRSSSFSSRGPTRDNRSKPDISAPGQYLEAALAAGSAQEGVLDRTRHADRLLTIEGTSMAAPFAAGTIALLLEAQPTLTTDQALDILKRGAAKDQHTTGLEWTPEYGYGKIVAPDLLRLLESSPAAPVPAPAAVTTAPARGRSRRRSTRSR